MPAGAGVETNAARGCSRGPRTVETVGIEPTPVCLQGRLAGPWHMRPRRQYSRQESNLPRPLCKRGASAARATGVSVSRAGRSRTCLGHLIRVVPRRSATARSQAPCTGLEPVSPVRQTGRHTRCVTGRRRVPGGSRTRLSTLARWCLGCSATDTLARSAEGTGVEPARAFASPGFQPGAVASRLALPYARRPETEAARCRVTPGRGGVARGPGVSSGAGVRAARRTGGPARSTACGRNPIDRPAWELLPWPAAAVACRRRPRVLNRQPTHRMVRLAPQNLFRSAGGARFPTPRV